MSSECSVLLVGCGQVAGRYNTGPNDETVLTYALACHRSPSVRLVACVDPDEVVRREFTATWQVPHAYESLSSALDADTYDIAVVASPTPTHATVLEGLLASPVTAVIGEKPLGGQTERARSLVDAFDKAGKPLAVAFVRRWDPAMVALKQEIASGNWGGLRTGVGFYGRGVVNNGSHMIDLVHYLTGGSLSILAVTGRLDDGVQDDPTVDAVLAVNDEASIHLAATDGRDYAFFELTLVFERGVVVVEDSGFSIRRRPVVESGRFPGARSVDAGEYEPARYGEAFVAMMENVVETVAHGAPLAGDGRSALEAITMADALRHRAAELESVA
ncbi:MAG: Gfo/Idh/MocA family oxidoreductase [Pseudomonadota bacterium]